jgi:octopine oxidase subunit B
MPDHGTRDVVIIGGGLIGCAAGLGMARRGADVALVEAEDGTFHASRANFGLVWAQSKGAQGPDYTTWTRDAIMAWPKLQAELLALTGVETHYRRDCGVQLCLSEEEFKKRSALIAKVASHKVKGLSPRMVDAAEVHDLVPGAGPEVVGGSVSDMDGDCHSLALYRGLTAGFQVAGGKMISGWSVSSITPQGDTYRVTADEHVISAPRILIAAGLGTNALVEPFGFGPLVRPQKGEILVTERTQPFLPRVMSSLRQTVEGTVLIGETKEETGFDDSSTYDGISELAKRAVRMFPAIGGLRVVRSWGGLRVLTRDGDPVYDESTTHPGIFVASTHSAVTLAPAHRGPLADWILGGQRPETFRSFGAARLAAAATQ